MRLVSVFAFVALIAAATVLACDDAQQVALTDDNRASRVSLIEASAGENLRICVESEGGRGIDYYFTSEAAATQWMRDAAFHYLTSNEPYTQPPSVVYHSQIAIPSLMVSFEVSAEQADSANKFFSVIVHATSACLGSGNSCVVDVAVHSTKVPTSSRLLLVIILCVVVAIFVCAMIDCIYCCCCKKKPENDPEHPADDDQPVVGQPMAEQQPNTPAEGQVAKEA